MACSSYQQPATTEPHAVVTFKRSAGEGGNLLTQGRILSYFIAANESCSEAPRVAAFATGDLAGSEKSLRVPAGVSTKLLAWLRVNDADFEGGVYQRTGQFDCSAVAEFSPSDGGTYAISFSVDETANCTFQVVDTESGDAPPNLVLADEVCSERPKMIPENSVSNG